jgi:hypothetical protein
MTKAKLPKTEVEFGVDNSVQGAENGSGMEFSNPASAEWEGEGDADDPENPPVSPPPTQLSTLKSKRKATFENEGKPGQSLDLATSMVFSEDNIQVIGAAHRMVPVHV